MPDPDPLGCVTDAERAGLPNATAQRPVAMLATLTDTAFSDPDWIFERKLDGIRCLAHRSERGVVRLLSRNDLDMSRTYPEIVEALTSCARTDLVVDGEIVAFEGKHTSFARLQGRSGVTDRQLAKTSGIVVFFYVFDVLRVAGKDVRDLPLLTRKRILRRAVDFADPLRYTSHRREAGVAAFQAACERGDEGVVAKRAAGRYVAGRSKEWLKFKCVRDQELVIGGWTEPQGRRTDFGALLLGYFDGADFVYAGKVGTGFNERVLRELGGRLTAIERTSSPFDRNRVRERNVHWAEPRLVAQIGFTEWTRDGMLRHPRFLGLRNDKSARDVVREQQ